MANFDRIVNTTKFEILFYIIFYYVKIKEIGTQKKIPTYFIQRIMDLKWVKSTVTYVLYCVLESGFFGKILLPRKYVTFSYPFF